MPTETKAVIVGAYEHPDRIIENKSLPQVIREVAFGALADAGISPADVDGYITDGAKPGMGPLSMVEYLGLRDVKYVDSTEIGGASYPSHVGHALGQILAGKAKIVLVTMGGLPRTERLNFGRPGPEAGFEAPYGTGFTAAQYALAARRHMYEFGTTSAQLAEIKVAAASHAQHNPNALLQKPVTVEEVLESPMVSDPLHRLDCCVITDGGGAFVIVHPDVAKDLPRRGVNVLGHGEALKPATNNRTDLTYTGARFSAPRAFAEAGLKPADMDYASIYDSFTITVLEEIEDLGFCEKGEGGKFVLDGALQAPFGKLPFNTDGGGLCNNHPDFRGGMTKVIEAVRQLRGEANAPVQVPDAQFAVVQGIGMSIGTRSTAATVVLGREDS
jgi:acetyl-CoA C-acetyltransferase